MIGGVSAGLGEYFDIDPVLVRALFIITALGYGIGLLAYIVLWIIVPERPVVYTWDEPGKKAEGEPVEQNEVKEESGSHKSMKEIMKQRSERKKAFGIILIIIGGLFFLNNVIPVLDIDYIWPVALIAVGGYIIYKTRSHNRAPEELSNEK